MAQNAALPGQPYPLVDGQMRITEPWYNALVQIASEIHSSISTLGPITGGALYTNGSYANVPLTGGSGSGAAANITVVGGSVTAVHLVNPGSLYQVGDVLSANAGSIGGTGSGFHVQVTAVTALNVPLPGQPYPLVDADRRITEPWYNPILLLANEAVGLGFDPALPGQPYQIVDSNRLITPPWYNSLVVIANSLL